MPSRPPTNAATDSESPQASAYKSYIQVMKRILFCKINKDVSSLLHPSKVITHVYDTSRCT